MRHRTGRQIEAGTLHSAFEEVARFRSAAKICFPSSGAKLTATELVQQAEAWGYGLMARRIRPGDVVGLLVPTGPELPLALCAVSRVGAALCPMPTPRRFVDPTVQARSLARIARAGGIRHVIGDQIYHRVLAELQRLVPGLSVIDPKELATSGLSAEDQSFPEVRA